MSNEHISVGAYALGLLEDQDSAAFETHLAGCRSCRTELAEFSPMREMLSGLGPVESPEDRAAGQPVTDLLRRRAAVSRRRSRWVAVAAIAACVAALGGGVAAGIALAPGQQAGGPSLAGQQHSATDPRTGVTGTVGLVTKGWGTQITLDLADVHGPVECQLIAVSTTGERRVVTGWFVPVPGDGVPGHPAHLLVQGGTAISLKSLSQLDVVVVNGRTLLTIPV